MIDRQLLSKAAYAITPPLIWNTYLRARRLGKVRPPQQFKLMQTSADTAPLFTGRFGAIHDRYYSLHPFLGPNAYRYVHYCACYFAERCRHVPGDFVIAGVAWGASAKVIYEFVDFAGLGKTYHLVDPFDAKSHDRVASNYNADPEYVLRQFPTDAPIKLHRQYIPIDLPGPLAFVFCDTGSIDAEVAALPSFYERMSPGAVCIVGTYGTVDTSRYADVVKRLGVTPFWLPSGHGVIIK